MKKRQYIQPTIEVIRIGNVQILAGSLGSDDTPNITFQDVDWDDSDDGYYAD